MMSADGYAPWWVTVIFTCAMIVLGYREYRKTKRKDQ